MRIQGQDRFTGQANWKAGRVGSATEQVIAAINEENRHMSAVLEPWPHQQQPKFSAILIFQIALLCELALAVGFLLGWRLGR